MHKDKPVRKYSLLGVLPGVVAVALVAGILIAGLFSLAILVEAKFMQGWMGGLFEMIGESVQNNKNLHYQRLGEISSRKHFKRDRAVAFDREDTAIQRRVKDAEAAGVHPLFAMGASVGGQSPMYVGPQRTNIASGDGGMGAMGAAIDRATDRRSIESHEAALAESAARRRLTEAQTDEITFDIYRKSAAARAMQASNHRQDVVKLTPDQMTSGQSRDPSVSAGRDHPAYREYVVSKWGLKMDLPYSEEGPSEALENVPFYLWPLIIQHNRAKYGDDWGQRFFNEFALDRAPIYRSESSRMLNEYRRRGKVPGQPGYLK